MHEVLTIDVRSWLDKIKPNFAHHNLARDQVNLKFNLYFISVISANLVCKYVIVDVLGSHQTQVLVVLKAPFHETPLTELTLNDFLRYLHHITWKYCLPASDQVMCQSVLKVIRNHIQGRSEPFTSRRAASSWVSR